MRTIRGGVWDVALAVRSADAAGRTIRPGGLWKEPTRVRRGSLLLMLIVLLLTCGGACLLMAERVRDAAQPALQTPQCCALVMFLLGGIAGLLAVTSFRRRTRKWARQIAKCTAARGSDSSVAASVPAPILAPMTELVPVASAINDVIAESARGVADAHLRVKELEIQ